MASRVEGVKNVIHSLRGVGRNVHEANKRGVQASTRKVQLGVRAEVNGLFTRNAKAGNAIRSKVYDNNPGGKGRVVRGGDVAGLVYSKFGRGRGAAYVDYLMPYITGRNIVPRQKRYLAIPLQPGKRNRAPRPDMKLVAVRIGGELFLVKNMRNKTLFMFRLVQTVRVNRRLRLARLYRGGGGSIAAAEIIKAYSSVKGRK